MARMRSRLKCFAFQYRDRDRHYSNIEVKIKTWFLIISVTRIKFNKLGWECHTRDLRYKIEDNTQTPCINCHDTPDSPSGKDTNLGFCITFMSVTIWQRSPIAFSLSAWKWQGSPFQQMMTGSSWISSGLRILGSPPPRSHTSEEMRRYWPLNSSTVGLK